MDTESGSRRRAARRVLGSLLAAGVALAAGPAGAGPAATKAGAETVSPAPATLKIVRDKAGRAVRTAHKGAAPGLKLDLPRPVLAKAQPNTTVEFPARSGAWRLSACSGTI